MDNVSEIVMLPVETPDEEQFFADEFFLDESDPGIEVKVKMRGRMVPVFLKRGLTLEDEMAAQAAALQKTVTPDGRVVIGGLNEKALVEEMLFRCIKSWPFKYPLFRVNPKTGQKEPHPQAGQPFPVTKENIRKMLGGADELAAAIKKLNTEGEKVLAPFVVTSAEA